MKERSGEGGEWLKPEQRAEKKESDNLEAKAATAAAAAAEGKGRGGPNTITAGQRV